MDNVIRCYCKRTDGGKVVFAVRNDDGSIERHRRGKIVRFEGPGQVYFACDKCGFEQTMTLDRPIQLAVG